MNRPRRPSRQIILWDGLGVPVASLGTYIARKSLVSKDFSDPSHLLIATQRCQADPPIVEYLHKPCAPSPGSGGLCEVKCWPPPRKLYLF